MQKRALNRDLLASSRTRAGLDFLVDAGREPITETDLAILQELREEHLREVEHWQDAYYLYELAEE